MIAILSLGSVIKRVKSVREVREFLRPGAPFEVSVSGTRAYDGKGNRFELRYE